MRSYIINPFAFELGKPPVVRYDYSGDYRDIYPALSEESLGIDVRAFATVEFGSEKDCLYVDDEGMMKSPMGFIFLQGWPEPLAGKGLVLGTDSSGDSVSCQMDVYEVSSKITLVSLRKDWQFAYSFQKSDWVSIPLNKLGTTVHEVLQRLSRMHVEA